MASGIALKTKFFPFVAEPPPNFLRVKPSGLRLLKSATSSPKLPGLTQKLDAILPQKSFLNIASKQRMRIQISRLLEAGK